MKYVRSTGAPHDIVVYRASLTHSPALDNPDQWRLMIKNNTFLCSAPGAGPSQWHAGVRHEIRQYSTILRN